MLRPVGQWNWTEDLPKGKSSSRRGIGLTSRHLLPLTPLSQMSSLSEPMSMSDGPDPRSAKHLPPATPTQSALSPPIESEESVGSGVVLPVNCPLPPNTHEGVSHWSAYAASAKHHTYQVPVLLKKVSRISIRSTKGPGSQVRANIWKGMRKTERVTLYYLRMETWEEGG